MEDFLLSFSHFCSIRGQPAVVYSDNITNFVAAERELKEEFELTAAKLSSNRMVLLLTPRAALRRGVGKTREIMQASNASRFEKPASNRSGTRHSGS